MLRQTNNIFVRQSGKTMHKIIMIFVALAIAVVCYSITVYAWYQDSISNDSNSITVGTFSADIQILDESDTVLWDSAADFPDGILGYEGNISLPVGTKPVSLKITNADADALSFQYQISLKADNNIICSAGITEKKVLAGNGWESYTITFPDSASNFTELYLSLRTSFENGIIDNPIILNLPVVQPSDDNDQTDPQVPSGTDQTDPQVPSGTDQTDPQVPSGTDQTDPQDPSGTDQTDPQVPSGTDQTDPQIPSGTDQTDPQIPSGTEQTDPQIPSGTDQTDPQVPSGTNQTDPQIPSGTDQTDPQVPSGTDQIEQ